MSKPGPISASPPARHLRHRQMAPPSRPATNANVAGACCRKSAATPRTPPSASAAARPSNHERASRRGSATTGAVQGSTSPPSCCSPTRLVKYWVLHGRILPDGHILVLLPVLNFVLVWNHGITFGMFAGSAQQDHPRRHRRRRHRSRCSSGSGAAITGSTPSPSAPSRAGPSAMSLDRLRYGAVVDFIQAHLGGIYFPMCSMSGIPRSVCGVAALMPESLLHRSPVAAGSGQR